MIANIIRKVNGLYPLQNYASFFKTKWVLIFQFLLMKLGVLDSESIAKISEIKDLSNCNQVTRIWGKITNQ